MFKLKLPITGNKLNLIFNHFNLYRRKEHLKYFCNSFTNSAHSPKPHHTKKQIRSKSEHLVSKSDDSTLILEESKPLKCTDDQWLYKPTPREIKLFLESKLLPSRPFDLENSVVINLVDLNKDVSSPVKSTIYFSEYGIRKGERFKLVVIWFLVSGLCTYLGFWQLKRKKWKENLLATRQELLNLPKLILNSAVDIKPSFNSPNAKDHSDYSYRVVEAKGVLDTKQHFLVGPRQSLSHDYGENVGYYVLYPLRFCDGSSLLVNMGWLRAEDVFDIKVTSEYVTVRGILVPGEITEALVPSLKYKLLSKIESVYSKLSNREVSLTRKINRPTHLVRNDDRKVYRYLDPQSIASQVFSSDPSITQKYIINVYDSYFDEDKPLLDNKDENQPTETILSRLISISGVTPANSTDETNRIPPRRYPFQRKQKSDYLLFYAGPDTHFNYAMQWFLMSFSISAMCVYKLLKVNRILRKIIS